MVHANTDDAARSAGGEMSPTPPGFPDLMNADIAKVDELRDELPLEDRLTFVFRSLQLHSRYLFESSIGVGRRTRWIAFESVVTMNEALRRTDLRRALSSSRRCLAARGPSAAAPRHRPDSA